MVGYPEAITDPSYFGQILTLTYPLIGNYGVPSRERDPVGVLKYFESEHVQVRALITAVYNGDYHHWNAEKSLGEWLAAEKIPGIHGVDTRALARYLRDKGSVPGRVVVEGMAEPDWYDPCEEDVIASVSRLSVETIGAGDPAIAVIDCGVKNNIVRCLLRRGAKVIVVPWNHDLSGIDYDGVLISNGPGNPARLGKLCSTIRSLLEDSRPLFGICLGCQLLGIAAGAATYKLPFGHRGQNQPVVERATGRWSMTSQNHGFAIDGDTLPDGWEVWFTNGNDGTVEGIRSAGGVHRAVQFHPEAVCGPVDTAYLFDSFLDSVRRAKGA